MREIKALCGRESSVIGIALGRRGRIGKGRMGLRLLLRENIPIEDLSFMLASIMVISGLLTMHAIGTLQGGILSLQNPSTVVNAVISKGITRHVNWASKLIRRIRTHTRTVDIS